jgi:hypothetical protein
LRKITILVAGSPSLSRIIEHLFRGTSEFEVVGSVGNLGNLGPHARRLLPELIVANVKPLSAGICRVVTFIKQASPSSTLILICPVEDLARVARKCGADACLQDEKLAGHLLRTARTLAERSRLANAGD